MLVRFDVRRVVVAAALCVVFAAPSLACRLIVPLLYLFVRRVALASLVATARKVAGTWR